MLALNSRVMIARSEASEVSELLLKAAWVAHTLLAVHDHAYDCGGRGHLVARQWLPPVITTLTW